MILLLSCFLRLHTAAKRAARHQAPAFVPVVVVIVDGANAALGARHGSSGGHPRPVGQVQKIKGNDVAAARTITKTSPLRSSSANVSLSRDSPPNKKTAGQPRLKDTYKHS